jgi:hypothetical protein
VLLLVNDNGARPGTGDAPLGYRFFFVDSLKMTSAAATMTAMMIFPTHLLGMSGTTLLRSGGPAEEVAEEEREPILLTCDASVASVAATRPRPGCRPPP